MPRVLVVDDYEDAAEIMAELLTMHGFEAKAETDVSKVLEAIRAWKPNAVLLDYLLDDEESGDGVLREILDAHPGVRVCVYTGWAPARQKLAALRNTSVFIKPSQFDELLEELRQLHHR